MMSMQTLIDLGILVVVFLGCWLLATWWPRLLLWYSSMRLAGRARQGIEQTIKEAQPAGLRALDLVQPVLPLFRPKTELDADKLKLFLARAGYHDPAASDIYLAARLAMAMLGTFIAGSAALAWRGVDSTALVIGLAGMAAGYMIPSLVVQKRQRRRQKQIDGTLPDVLDLVAVAVEAGNAPDVALREAAVQLRELAPTLVAELELFFKQVDLGRGRRDSLHDLALRANTMSMHSAVNLLIQTHRFGTGVAEAIRDLSQRMRIARRQLAEERAHKAGFLLIFPLVLFIFPGVFLALVGPAVVLISRDMLALN